MSDDQLATTTTVGGLVGKVKGLVTGLTGATPTPDPVRTPALPAEARFRRVHVIINPAAGQDEAVLPTLNRVFKEAGVDWDVFITKEAGDAKRFAVEAVAAQADAVAVYGGDGSVAEVASGLIGSTMPLAILPGGTANVASVELGIPGDLERAVRLLTDPTAILRPVDMGEVNGETFILRVGLGLEAQMVQGADRDLKNRMGTLAYALAALQALRDPQLSHYHLTIDGQTLDSDGVLCIIANMGSTGQSGLTLAPTIDPSDGLLDVLIVRQSDLRTLLSLATQVVAGSEPAPTPGEALQYWQGREVMVRPTPPQSVQVDGEILEAEEVQARVIPQGLRVLVPAPPAAQQVP